MTTTVRLDKRRRRLIPTFCPIERQMWRDLYRLEDNVLLQIGNLRNDAPWTLENTGAICCWNISGRVIGPKPSLDYYEGDIGHP